MKQFQIAFLLIPSVIALTGLKKNYSDNKSTSTATGISIGNTIVVEGNGGQRAVDVMVIISAVETSAVTVSFSTTDKSASAGSDYVAAKGTVTFAPGETMKRITVSVTGDQVCEPNETFEIVLSGASGAILTNSVGKITIANDDCKGGSSGGNSIGRNLAVYEVRLTYTGYTSLYGVPPDCPVRTNGKVVLTGLVSGGEDVDPEDDISYTGVLQIDIDMDICSVKRLANGEDRFCRIRALGWGEVKTELEIYSDGQDSARGGYIKINNDTNEFIRLASGDCNKAEEMEEQDMIPNRTIASIFNGKELLMLPNKYKTLQVGRYVETGSAGETVVEVLRKIN
jgi:hypothetical protein